VIEHDRPRLLRSKLFWVAILYFSEGFPLGLFFDLFPVYFRQQGVDLGSIGLLSLLGLAWTVKFLWAPAIDHYRHHRYWMVAVDGLMGATLMALSQMAGFGPGVWLAIGHVISAVLCFITVIGIPFGVQHLKLAGIALAPIGKTIVVKEVAAAARKQDAEAKVARLREGT